ncbi:MAG: LUD domain-containing protein [Kiritimatiellae bacterium]|nr:LUD domain-containing protein [Kiritimatiellia bacterium]
MKNDDMEIGGQRLAELFTARAEAVAAKVSRVADITCAERLIAEEKSRLGTENVGVAHAVLGIAATGTCVVETDDEETRLSTMLPETSIITLNISNIVPGITDIAHYMRERQKDGKISYTSLITGPSRTADIERVGAIGVHGPLSVHIILLEG